MPWFRSIGPTRGLSSESSGLRRRGDGVDNTGGREFFEGLGLATFFNAPRAAPGVDAVHTPHGRSKERSPCRIQWLLAWKLDVDGLKRTSCREPMAAGGSNYPARGSGSTRSLGPERLVVSKIRSATSTRCQRHLPVYARVPSTYRTPAGNPGIRIHIFTSPSVANFVTHKRLTVHDPRSHGSI